MKNTCAISLLSALFFIMLVSRSDISYAQNTSLTSSFEGGKGLLLMESARTIGQARIMLGMQSLVMQKDTSVLYQKSYIKDYPVIAGIPLTVGLTDEVDISASVYFFNDTRPYINPENVTRLYGKTGQGIGSSRFGVKIRLPFKPESRIQIAGKMGAMFDTSKEQTDGLNYRWTRKGTDIEASLLETLEPFKKLSLNLEQGYVLSGSKYYDDQYVLAAGLDFHPTKGLIFGVEANTRSFDTISPEGVLKADSDLSKFYNNPALVGNPLYLKDDKIDFTKDFFVVVPSVTCFITKNIALHLGAAINLAEDQAEPKEKVQYAAGLTFGGAMNFLLDDDGDGVKNNIDKEPNTPRGFPVNKLGVSLDTDGDGVPDGRDREPDTPKGAIVDKWGVSIDSDGDGVPDGLDKEPNTPKGAVVDKWGISVDTDGDGVPDGLDIEPNTPKGVIVDKWGAGMDTDGDGVPDGLDEEPNTPKGLKVDIHGKGIIPKPAAPVPVPAPIKQEEQSFIQEGIISVQKIHFNSGSSVITEDSYDILNEIALIFAKYPALKIEIAGHTDNEGRRDKNIELSTARAKAVLDFLLKINKSLRPGQFTVQGYGPDKPVASNDTAYGRQMNRRVEFVVINKEELKNIQLNK